MPRATVTAILNGMEKGSIRGLVEAAIADIRSSYFTTINGIATLTGSNSAYLAELSDVDNYRYTAANKVKER